MLFFKPTYAALLGALLTPHKLLIVRSNRKLPNVVSNCGSCIFSFQYSKLKLRCRSYSMSKLRFSFSFSGTAAFSSVFNGAYILSIQSNVNVASLSLVFILDYKSGYVPLKYRFPIKMHRPTYLIFKSRIPYSLQYLYENRKCTQCNNSHQIQPFLRYVGVFQLVFLDRTPIFDCWAATWGSKSKHHQGTYSKKIGLHMTRLWFLVTTQHSIHNIIGRTVEESGNIHFQEP